MYNLLMFLVVMYLGLIGGMYFLQRKIMYLPSTELAAPEFYELRNTQIIELTTQDVNATMGWYLPGLTSYPTLLYFHGNAGNLGDRAYKFKAFNDAGFPVLAVSYRGYGKSGGEPTEEGLYNDARALLTYAKLKLGLHDQQIMLYGESLGSGVAVHMASEHTVGGVVLEAPYTSVVQRASEIYPIIPVRLLIKDKYESLQKIGSVHSPLLILHGKMDQTIPYTHGETLLKAANPPKRGVFYETYGHVDFEVEELVRQLTLFATEHKLIR